MRWEVLGATGLGRPCRLGDNGCRRACGSRHPCLGRSGDTPATRLAVERVRNIAARERHVASATTAVAACSLCRSASAGEVATTLGTLVPNSGSASALSLAGHTRLATGLRECKGRGASSRRTMGRGGRWVSVAAATIPVAAPFPRCAPPAQKVATPCMPPERLSGIRRGPRSRRDQLRPSPLRRRVEGMARPCQSLARRLCPVPPRHELCWELGDAVIRRRVVLAYG
jgi:hypothetical protein